MIFHQLMISQDLNRIAQLGAENILLLMSDSTDATHPGYQISESAIGDEMGNYLKSFRTNYHWYFCFST